jgi:predicted MFS family arabinose efflux permease
MLANRMGGRTLAGTAQGLLISTTGMAGVIGSLLSGWLLDQLSSRGLFLIMACIAFCSLTLFFVGTLRQRSSEVGEASPAE